MTNKEIEQEKRDFINFGMNVLAPILSAKCFNKVYTDIYDSGHWFYCFPRETQYCFFRESENSISYRSLKSKGLNDQEILQELIKYFNIEDMLVKGE